MRNFNIFKTGIQTVFVLGVIWIIFFFTTNAYNNLYNNNLNYIPFNSDIIIQVDVNQLLKGSIEGLLDTEDNEFIQLIKNIRGGIAEEKIGELGIAINTKTILFSISDEGNRFYGAVFNLTNQKSFQDYFSTIENTGIASSNDVGLIVLMPRTQSNKNTFAESLFIGNHASIDLKNTIDPIVVWTKSTTMEYNRLDIQLEKESIHFSGKLSKTLHTANNIKSLSPDGFHTTISNVPDCINDSIQGRFGDAIPNISGISFNYFGTELIEDPEFLVAPEGDFLVQFEKPIHLDSCIKQFQKEMFIDSVKGNKYYYGPKTYYSKQVSERLIYIGVHDYDSTHLKSQRSLLFISGDINNLTHINSRGFLKYLLEIIPIYKAAKQLTGSIKSFEVKLTAEDEKTIHVKGDIVFNKVRYASIEFIRFFLASEFFK